MYRASFRLSLLAALLTAVAGTAVDAVGPPAAKRPLLGDQKPVPAPGAAPARPAPPPEPAPELAREPAPETPPEPPAVAVPDETLPAASVAPEPEGPAEQAVEEAARPESVPEAPVAVEDSELPSGDPEPQSELLAAPTTLPEDSTVEPAPALEKPQEEAFGDPIRPTELPPETASFTADGLVQIGDDRLSFRIHHLEGRERQDMTVDGLYQITILRPDLGTAYLVQPKADTFIPLMLEEVSLWPRYRALEGYEIKAGAWEVLAGERVRRYHVSSTEAALQPMDVLVWITEDGIEVRLEGEMDVEGITESVVLLRQNIERQPIEPSLFDPAAAIRETAPPIAVPSSHKDVGKVGP